MNNLTIVKVGGSIISDSSLLEIFLGQFAAIKGSKILVHGGGKSANAVLNKMNITPSFINGRRITDKETLEVVTMVYAGSVNTKLVSMLQSIGCNALGITGADGNIVQCEKRKVVNIDYGYAGDVVAVHTGNLEKLLSSDFVPVCCPITHDSTAQLLNTNADTIASTLAVKMTSLYKVSLRYCFEFNGVLANVNDEDSIISTISADEFETLQEDGIIQGGMIPKVFNAVQSKAQGVHEVVICGIKNMLDPTKATLFL